MKTAVGQAVQSAALSRIAFLSVLDLRARSLVSGLSNIQNDVSVITQQQQGGYAVSIVLIQTYLRIWSPFRYPVINRLFCRSVAHHGVFNYKTIARPAPSNSSWTYLLSPA